MNNEIIEQYKNIIEKMNMEKYVKKTEITIDHDLVGMKLNKLTVLCETGYRNKRRRKVLLCLCECGRYTLQTRDSLIRNDGKETKSCGCLLEKTWRSSRIMKIFRSMIARTKNNSNSSCYTKNNIKICDDWINNPEKFYLWSLSNGYDDSKTIDRISNTEGYNPENCRWVNKETQSYNKTQIYKIKEIPLHYYEKEMKLENKHTTIVDRFKKGWDFTWIFQEYFLNNFIVNDFYIDEEVIRINNECINIDEYCEKYNVSKIAIYTRLDRDKNINCVIKEFILKNSELMCVEIIERVLQNVSRVD